jgi:hypothetical protein
MLEQLRFGLTPSLHVRPTVEAIEIWAGSRFSSARIYPSMKFCRPDLCRSCPLAKDKPACLRQKVEFCTWLAARISNPDLHAAVEKMRLELLDEADAREKVIVAILD